MGRRCFGDLDHKFWFGTQPTEDILEYGRAELLSVVVDYENLEEIRAKVKRFKGRFRRRFKMAYREFMTRMNEEGYHSVAKRAARSKKWASMTSLAALIDLGEDIIRALEAKRADLFIEAPLC